MPYSVVEVIPSKTEYKALGTGLMFLGCALSLTFSSILKKEYERLEQSYYKLRQSEFELEDLHRDQTVEVQRWAIELDAQSDIREISLMDCKSVMLYLAIVLHRQLFIFYLERLHKSFNIHVVQVFLKWHKCGHYYGYNLRMYFFFLGE